ncbi:MAG: type II secretion system protein [Bacilli bacterium]|jgi:prepilin-type N-terminal cleavage/methylation domain-containing protein|nr:type II secretion system protein [Bacilli bacterium]
MQNQKGFTLIELIATIALMVLMGLIIVNNLNSLFSSREEEDLADFKELLENAACTYIDLSDPQIKQKKQTCKVSGCTVTTNVLIQNSLLDEELKNPMTGRAITGLEVIKISYPNQEKTCVYEME